MSTRSGRSLIALLSPVRASYDHRGFVSCGFQAQGKRHGDLVIIFDDENFFHVVVYRWELGSYLNETRAWFFSGPG